MELMYQNKVYTPEGDLEYDSGVQESKSFVMQYLEHIYCLLNWANLAGVKDTLGTDRNLLNPDNSSDLFCRGSGITSDDEFGILVGTDNTAVTNIDHKLGTKIIDGNGAAQLQYSEMFYTAPAVVGDYVQFDTYRNFANESGSSITIKETGLGVASYYASTTGYFLIIRDVPVEFDLANTYTATVKYTFRTQA